MENNKYPYRSLARLIIETVTPLAVSSGEKGLYTDSLVARDVNDLPYIPGTAVAGVVRHAIKESGLNDSFFGFAAGLDGKDGGRGSEILFSSAQMVDEKGNIVEGLVNPDSSPYLKLFKEELPVRQHVCINELGVAKKHGKFDEEVVFKGTRFCFEIELLSSEKGNRNLVSVLSELSKDTIRVGGGTRKGFGEFKLVENECKFAELDLNNPDDLNLYIRKTSSLNDGIWNSNCVHSLASLDMQRQETLWTEYKLILKPDDFFLFSSGFGDDEADIIPVTESFIDWSTGMPILNKDAILIPASSVKGAVAHRVAYHYNRLKKHYIDELSANNIPDLVKEGYLFPPDFDSTNQNSWRKMLVENNPAVSSLFGFSSQDEKLQQRGNVLVSDVIQGRFDSGNKKIFNHISIDRFTGGGIDGALFSEKVVMERDVYVLVFKVNNKALINETVKDSFEDALFDLAQGLLPLGGGTNRGHGCFTGQLYKDSEEIKR